jgi:hypothetical protein
MEYEIITGKNPNHLRELQSPIILKGWPDFMFHDDYVDRFWDEIFHKCGDFQFVIKDKGSDTVLAVGNSMPLRFDDSINRLPDKGLDWALEKSFNDLQNGIEPNIQCAFQIVINREYLGQGLSSEMIRIMASIGKQNGFDKLIAPVRPNNKHLYPLIPIEKYVLWKNGDGLPFDPWMRVHERLKAETVRVCPESMHIVGTVADWESWTGMKFPESGDYVIPGALVPVKIDIERDKGIYLEPNVWMVHRM